MNDLIKNTKKEWDGIIEFYNSEVSSLRAGRATPALVENVKVEAYGSLNDISHIASISLFNAKSIVIQPWDKSLVEVIVKTLSQASLGMQPVVQEDRIILTLPELTRERREEILRVLGNKTEEALVSLRNIRDKTKSAIQSAEKKKEISEDDKFRYLEELQEAANEYKGKIEEIERRKNNELNKI